MAILSRSRRWLAEPMEPLRLRWIRRGFGALMVVEMLRYLLFDWVRLYFVEPTFHFSYPGFEWVQPFPMVGMVALFLANGVAAAAIMWGIHVRLAAAMFTCGWCYTTLIDQTYYQNHWVLVGWVGLFFTLVGHEQTARRWSHALLQLQVGVVYIFAGVAKLNSDWIMGQPMTIWLAKRSDWAHIGPLLALPETGLVLSWIGLAFDLLIVPLLLWTRTRWAAFWIALAFHCSNAILFKIGIFPALMIVLTTIFLPARRNELQRVERPVSMRLLALLCVWGTVQIVVPVRHWFIPGDVAWTEEGHRFSWRMKTRSKVGSVVFHALDTREGVHEVIDRPADLTVHQYRKMATRPEMIRQYARHLAAVRSGRGSGEWAIHADARATLNGRPASTLVDPTVDLVQAEPSGFGASWITPLD